MYRLPAGITRHWPQEKERKAMVQVQTSPTAEAEFPGIFAGVDTENRWKCPGCDTIYEDDDDSLEPVYECNNCGNVFNRSESDYESHRCDCGKFAARAFDGLGCPDACHEELEQVEGAECPECGDFIEVADFATHSAECGAS